MTELTATHREVLAMYADGKNRKQIAAELGYTVNNVKRLTKEACHILDARNRTHAVAVAWRARLIV